VTATIAGLAEPPGQGHGAGRRGRHAVSRDLRSAWATSSRTL
jgi:hypothetical protein